MRHVDSFEIQPPTPPSHNGVPRSAWARARRRVVPLAPAVHRDPAAARLRRGRARQLDRRSALRPGRLRLPGAEQDRPGSTSSPTCCLPLGWLVILWGNGAYDRRYLGLGTTSSSGSSAPSSTVAASVSFLAFATKTELSRWHGRHRPARRAAATSCSGRYWPGRCCTASAGGPARPRTGCCWSARCPRRSRSTRRSPAARPPAWCPVAIHLTDGYAAARGIADPGAGLRRPRRAGPGPRGRRRHHRGLRLGQRRAGRAAPAGLAAGGHRHRPGGRAAADRHRRPAGAHPADRGPAAAARRGADALRAWPGWPRTCWTGSPPALGLLLLLPLLRW